VITPLSRDPDRYPTGKARVGKEKTGFLETYLDSVEKELLKDLRKYPLEGLFDLVEERGQVLLEAPGEKTAQRYLATLSTLIQRTLSEVFHVKELRSLRNKKVYLVVENLDKEKEKILASIREKEKGKARLAQSLSRIRGLIVELKV